MCLLSQAMNTVMDSSSVRRKLFVLVQIALMLSLPVRACPTVVQNPLSIGRVDNCVSPRTNISTECQGIITWDVPEAMSSLSSIKDAYIRGILEQIDGGAEDEACTNGIRHMLCIVEYPRCLMNISQVDTAISREEDCRDRLSSCTSSRQVFCDFLITDGVALDKCRTIDDYAITYNYNFTFCNRLTSPDWLNTYVTEWMFLYLINIDEEIKKIDDKNLLTFPRNTDCEQRYLFFKCNSIGRCWNQGTQIELIVNQSDCEVVRSNWYVTCMQACTHCMVPGPRYMPVVAIIEKGICVWDTSPY